LDEDEPLFLFFFFSSLIFFSKVNITSLAHGFISSSYQLKLLHFFSHSSASVKSNCVDFVSNNKTNTDPWNFKNDMLEEQKWYAWTKKEQKWYAWRM